MTGFVLLDCNIVRFVCGFSWSLLIIEVNSSMSVGDFQSGPVTAVICRRTWRSGVSNTDASGLCEKKEGKLQLDK